MEVKEKSKKRELIKSIAIVFLAVLLVLTFFSNTIMNHSLPEVATQAVYSGTINAKIRGSGTVSPNESYDVIINQTREVRSVCVKVGDTVEQGDLLFVLGDVESQELKSAMEALSSANLSYQERLLNLSKEGVTEDRNIQKIREDLQKAIQERDLNTVTDTDISYAKGELAAAKSELSQIGLILAELNEMMADNEEYLEAKAEVDRLTGEIASLESKIAGYKDQLDQIVNEGGVDFQRNLEKAQREVDDAKNQLASDEVVYKTTYEAFAQFVKTHYGDVVTNDKVEMYMEAYITAGKNESNESFYASYKTAYETLTKDRNALEEAKRKLKQLQEDADIANGSINEQRREVQAKLDAAQSDLSYANRQLREANYALDAAEGGSDALKDEIKLYEAAKREQDAYIEQLNDQLTELNARKVVYDAAVETIAAKERELEDTLSGKDIDEKLDDLDLQRLRLEIQKQQELVDKYKEESIDTEVKANVSGTISAINVSAGKDTTSGSPMAVIDVVDRGFTIRIPVTNQQAKQVKVGDNADVTNYYWGNDITAVLESIIPDPAKPGQGKMLVFRVTGDIDAGTNITLSIGQKSANFDAVIPKSALRSDTNGDFVLVMTSKSTPLGNRYTATRVDVQILAEDDTTAAVSGLRQGQDYVITTSNKPLEAGTQVRMVDEA